MKNQILRRETIPPTVWRNDLLLSKSPNRGDKLRPRSIYLQNAWQVQTIFTCAINGVFIAGIRMAHGAGSFHNTRAMRRSASSVPSKQMTMSECCENPMPTPPPWCSDTHVAADAVLSSAFKSGQSDTASEPSFMLSFSRLGDAMEPDQGGRGQ